MSSTNAGRNVRTNQAKSIESSSKPVPGSSSKPYHESNLRSVSSNGRTCRSAKAKHDKPSDGSTKAGSSVSGLILTKTNHSIKHTVSRATSAPEGLLKIKDAISRAGSASFCAQDDEGLSALETLETLKIIFSSGSGYNFYQVPPAVGPHSVLMNNNHERAENAFVVDTKNGKKARRHCSRPTRNAADNVIISQDRIHRSSARKTISSESRGTRQMVAFCETERLKARSLSAKAHSGAQTDRPANSILWAFQTWLVLCILLVFLWKIFMFLYGL